MVPVTFDALAVLSVAVAFGCVAAWAVAGTEIVTEAGALITTVYDCVTGGCVEPVAAVAEIVNVELPAAVGVPLTTPVVAFKLKPAGSVPTVTAQLEIASPCTVNVVDV